MRRLPLRQPMHWINLHRVGQIEPNGRMELRLGRKTQFTNIVFMPGYGSPKGQSVRSI
jgi:hypothetical protein